MESICELYASGEYTIASCCEANGISYRTFVRWCRQSKRYDDLYELARALHRKVRFEGLSEKALNSFERLITGYNYEEQHTEHVPTANGKTALRRVRIITKHVPPHAGMVAMAMKKWHGMKDAQQLEHSVQERQAFFICSQQVVF